MAEWNDLIIGRCVCFHRLVQEVGALRHHVPTDECVFNERLVDRCVLVALLAALLLRHRAAQPHLVGLRQDVMAILDTVSRADPEGLRVLQRCGGPT